MRHPRMAASLVGFSILIGAAFLETAFVGAVSAQEAFCGKYRGTVTNGADPLLRGRVQVLVPDVSDTELWALPAVQFGDPFRTPSVGQKVWVEYEACDSASPIWTGGFDASCVVERKGAGQRCKLDP
jgi:hypothetical protein